MTSNDQRPNIKTTEIYFDMKLIFQKTSFPKAPGGDRYEWKEAETIFEVPKTGRYLITITASAQNGQQNGAGDDDDLRVTLNGFPFGSLEVHEEMISWKGFGTSAAWDGASLKGANKTVYFFLELEPEIEKWYWFNVKKQHTLKFFADGKPDLRMIEVFELNRKKDFTLKNLRPLENVFTDRKGIPWMSFVFLGVHPKNLEVTAKCQSGRQKNGTDGDNIKVVVNGKILINPEAPISDTYKNFYFSGDQMQGQGKTLELKVEDLDFTENTMELWYDQTPILEKLQIDFFEKQAYLKELEKEFIRDPEGTRQEEYENLKKLAYRGQKWGLKYAPQFLLHSLQKNPQEIVFESNDPLIRELKKDKAAYEKILQLVQKGLTANKLQDEIVIDQEKTGEINFQATKDLAIAIHGIKKVAYEAIPTDRGSFNVNITLFDRYDFNPKEKIISPANWLAKMGDKGEKVRVITNFPIRIKLKENIKL